MKEIILYSNHTHSFSRTFAAKYGVNAALVLGYIGFRIGLSKNERAGKSWYYDTLDTIAQHYPYLGRSAIYDAIQRLTQTDGPLIVGNYNKRKGDRTNWYAFRDEDAAQLLKKKPLYFKVGDAELYGVPAAVLLNNLAYHINKKRKETPGFRIQALSASKLANVLPFSRSTRVVSEEEREQMLINALEENRREIREHKRMIGKDSKTTRLGRIVKVEDGRTLGSKHTNSLKDGPAKVR